ncbi:MAG: TIGR02530 family flagellar biosynthesis protein [Myxococcota bacterium]|nr:TIGR02530 family flagellar biosynthesis protein [Myxococcota bacterium]
MSVSDVDFASAVQRVQNRGSEPRTRTGAPRDDAAFERALERATRGIGSGSPTRGHGVSRPGDPAGGLADVRFSRHASARLESRGIELSQVEIGEISSAVDRLHQKGARESLLLMGDHAFVVGVPRRTVITAMTRQEAVGSIFTNIDSTLVMR